MAFHSCVKRTYCVHAAYMPRTCIPIICHVSRFDYVLSFIQQFGLNLQYICEGVQSFLSASLHCYAVISFKLPANALPITSEVGLPLLQLVPVQHFSQASVWYLSSLNFLLKYQRTNGPVNAHLTFSCIPTTVKREKGQHQFFRCSRAANSVVPDRIWPNFELIKALIYVIITCKYVKDLIKNS